MLYLDTCICVEFLRGRLRHGYNMMRESRPEDFQLPAIVVAELFYGAEHSDNPEKQLKLVDAFVSAFKIAPFDRSCAQEYGKLRQKLASSGNLIGDRDIMIAATARANGATLVTNNENDFKRIPDFAFESWAEIDI